MTEWWAVLLWCLLALVIGLVGGFFVGRWYFGKQIKENPPINEKMIRVMYQQMGRKPSEAQIKAIMNSINKQK